MYALDVDIVLISVRRYLSLRTTSRRLSGPTSVVPAIVRRRSTRVRSKRLVGSSKTFAVYIRFVFGGTSEKKRL